MNLILDKITKYLLLIFLFILPWQTRWLIYPGSLVDQYWEYGTISLYVSDILLIIIFLCHLLNFKLKKHHPQFTISSILGIILLILLISFNVFFSLNKNLSLFHFSWLILGFILFTLLRQNIIEKKIAILSFILGAALVALLGIYQFASQATFSSTYLGLAEHKADALGSSAIETIAPDGFAERWLRAYGSLDHPNMLGGLCALGIILSWFLILEKNYTPKEEIIIMTAYLALSGGLLVSFSRAGWLATALSLILYLIIKLKQNFKNTLKKIWPLIIVGLTIIIALAIPYYYIFLPRLTGQGRLEQISNFERLSSYQEAWSLIKEKPWLGYGLNNYGLALEQNYPKKIIWFYQPVHNIFILSLAELGIIGFGLIIVLIGQKIINSIRLVPQHRPIILAGILALTILGLFDHWLISLHFGVFFSAVILGLILEKPTLTETN